VSLKDNDELFDSHREPLNIVRPAAKVEDVSYEINDDFIEEEESTVEEVSPVEMAAELALPS
jgi:hypothetical protein